MPKLYKAIVEVDDRATFIRDVFQARNRLFASKVRVTTVEGSLRLVHIESEDYLCVEDVLIVELGKSVKDAEQTITSRFVP